MNEDYLWDRTGPPDPEIERLEQTLAPLRYRHRADVLREKSRGPRAWWAAAAAAAVLATVAASLSHNAPPAPATAWRVRSMEGQALLGGQAAAIAMPLRAGDTIRTGDASQLSLRATGFGFLDIGPGSELRSAGKNNLTLQQGMLHALILARPREFVVDTPSARAVDLGCEYTLNVDPSGNGLIRVSLGWVAFQYEDHESFIPAGAACVTRKRSGPGIPFYEDAPEDFKTGLAALEEGDSAALSQILEAARPDDGLTLWHLMTRLPQQQRGAVYDRFVSMITVPKEVTREAVVRLDGHAIDLCWDSLALQSTEWWRGWERRW